MTTSVHTSTSTKRFTRFITAIALAATSFVATALPSHATGTCSDSTAPMALTYTLTGADTVGLPINGLSSDVVIDWGDSNTSTATTPGQVTHAYAGAGTYTINICGGLTVYGNTSYWLAPDTTVTWLGISKLTSVDSWGDRPLTSLSHAFYGASGLTSVPSNLPSTVSNMTAMFYNASTFNSANVSTWNTSNVDGIAFMFCGASAFNQNIGSWDVSHTTNFTWLFNAATAFNNGGSDSIKNWDVSHVTTMAATFSGTNFNQPIGSWTTTALTDMSSTFAASQFNQPLANWDVSHVTTFVSTFMQARFNQDIGSWNVGAATTMANMFQTSFFNNAGSDSIKNWRPANVTMFAGMFWNAMAFNQPIDDWRTTSALNMNSMFKGAYYFNQPLPHWTVGTVTSMNGMFAGYNSLQNPFNQDIGNWDVHSVTNFAQMFKTSKFNNGGSDSIKNWTINSSASVNMSEMFAGSYFNQPIADWDMSQVTNITKMFQHLYIGGWLQAASRFDQDLTGWDLSGLVAGAGNGMDNIFNKDVGTNTGYAYSTKNYDKFLLMLDAQSATLPSGLYLNANKTSYSCVSEAARARLVADKGMVITDNGLAAAPPTITKVNNLNGSVKVTVTFTDCADSLTDIKYSTDNGLTWTSTAGTALTFTISSLTNGTTYPIKVRGVTLTGDGAPSQAMNGTPDARTPLYAVPDAITVDSGTAGPLTVTWKYYTDPADHTTEVTDPSQYQGSANAGWVAPECTLSVNGNAYDATVAAGTYADAITCTGGDGGDAYNLQTSEVANLVVNTPVTLDPVPSGKFAPLNAGKSKISWKRATGATKYVVKVGGKVVCTTAKLTCKVKRLLGPASKVTVTSKNSEESATPTTLTYKATKRIQAFVVHFSPDSSELRSRDKLKLKRVAKALRTAGFTKLTVAGYTDNQNGEKNAVQLSKARAVAVKKYVAKYLDVTIVSKAKGNTNFVASNKTKDGRSKNRRAVGYVK